MRGGVMASCFLGILSLTSPLAQADVFFSTFGDGAGLATVDQSTAASVPIGFSGFPGTYAAAFAPNGTLYTIVNWATNANQLATFNTTTGAATPVGAPFGVPSMLALEVSNSGTIYGGSWGTTNNFFSINPTTGAPTVIGSTGMDFMMDFSFDSQGTLWAVNNAAGNDLWTIDLTTGVATHVTSITGADGLIMGIMFDANDVLYATTYINSSSLFTVDTTTGVATLVGNTGLFFAHGGDFQLAVAAVPEPLSLAVWTVVGLLGSGAIAGRRRRVSST